MNPINKQARTAEAGIAERMKYGRSVSEQTEQDIVVWGKTKAAFEKVKHHIHHERN
jgi:hypothetical protein